MPVDYSKWDALELSDDSDIEVHPNVDKRSFIRAKQNQIHQQRYERRHRITTLKYEHIINDGLLARIDALLRILESHKVEAQGKSSDEVDELVFDALTDVTSDGSLGDNKPPTPPEGVHTKEPMQSFDKMLGVLIDQVKAEVEKSKDEKERYNLYIREVQSHRVKVQGLQKDLNADLANLEREEGSKITSESIHTGFNSSHVTKNEPSTTVSKPKTTEQELLNPGASMQDLDAPIDEEDMEASPTAKQFAKIGLNDFSTSLSFISKHPEILVERETDGLLVEAFNAQQNATTKKEEEYARHCVHQALLLQYCRQLGKDGVGLFFKRIQTQGHQARKLFLDDVNNTYARIRSRTAELNKLKEEEGADREQIQLHAVDPGTTINIVTPAPFNECTTDDERKAREIFESFTPELQKALESGSLDAVNEVLGKMSVEEAEKVVEMLGNGGMLSLEGGVIDATTEEGMKQVEAIGQSRRMPEKEVLSVDEID